MVDNVTEQDDKSLSANIGFVEGVLRGIKSSPGDFRVEAIDEALDRLRVIAGRLGASQAVSAGLTERALEALQSRIEDCEVERLELLRLSIESWGESELHRRFDPGTYGAHEALHCAWMLMETWEHYVTDHATLAMDAEAYRLARLTSALMHEVYQALACRDGEPLPTPPVERKEI